MRHSRAASKRLHRPCPIIWASASPPLAKKPYGFRRGSVFLSAVRRVHCFSSLPDSKPDSKPRFLVDSDLLRRSAGAAISCLPAVPLARFHLREVFNLEDQYKPWSFLLQEAVDNLLFWRNFSGKSPENLQELCPDHPSTALYTDASGTTGWGSVMEPPHEATRSSAG